MLLGNAPSRLQQLHHQVERAAEVLRLARLEAAHIELAAGLVDEEHHPAGAAGVRRGEASAAVAGEEPAQLAPLLRSG